MCPCKLGVLLVLTIRLVYITIPVEAPQAKQYHPIDISLEEEKSNIQTTSTKAYQILAWP